MRAILHVDMDAFYASVEELDRPELRGRPLIVGGAGGRGVVAAANYVVRRYGVRSAMPIAQALRRCPEAICVPPRMARYREVSDRVFDIFREFTPVIEGLSLDEAFLDVTASERLLGGALKIGREIRRRIRAHTGLTASVGIAHNKLLAKIASDLNKPDGLCHLSPDDARAVLDALPVERLFGIGPKTLPGVLAKGIRTCGDLRRARDAVLWSLFGKHGAAMRERASGNDDRPVVAHRGDQSISAEETFPADLRGAAALQAELLRLTDRAAARLRAGDLAATCLAVKVRRGDFTTYTRQRSFHPASRETAFLGQVAAGLLGEWLRLQPNAAVRLLGVGFSGLQSERQAELFAATQPKYARLDAAVDDIRRRFGSGVLTRASLIPADRAGQGPSRRTN